ncbi:MAG TPA: chromate efflux transporter [Candidatus Limnocylindrales bacterium]|nr:chromate efflux transporter [Candidatus Limnocylindrales bacterium]
MVTTTASPGVRAHSTLEVFLVALRLGLTSFGGPIAHLGYFRETYVVRRGWLGERAFADLVALCQLLPGPASSQLGIAIGAGRAGVAGGIAAWLGFTLPAAVLLVLFAAVYRELDLAGAAWVHGLTVAAGAVVAAAVVGMARALTPDLRSRAMAVLAGLVALAWAGPLVQAAIIVGGAMAGLLLSTAAAGSGAEPSSGLAGRAPGSRRTAIGLMAVFVVLLVGLPLLRALVPSAGPIALADAFYRSGALVFGGGHVVLPLLEATVVEPGWVAPDAFLAGYGAAQAVPGPLFSVAGFLGAVSSVGPGGPAGAAIALGAVFLPSFLLVFAALAAWPRGGPSPTVRRALAGANAAVVGLLLAALVGTVLPAALRSPVDVVTVVAGTLGLVLLRLPPILVVVVAAVVSALVAG